MTKAAVKAANATALRGFTNEVDELVRLAGVRATAEAETEAIRATLDELAKIERAALERQGIATKQIAFKGTGKDARYTFPDAYAPLPASQADDLRTMLGAGAYAQLFERRVSRSLRPGAADALIALLGDQAGDYFDEVPTIAPVEGFGAKRAAMRGALSDVANEALDHVVAGISKRPSLTLK